MDKSLLKWFTIKNVETKAHCYRVLFLLWKHSGMNNQYMPLFDSYELVELTQEKPTTLYAPPSNKYTQYLHELQESTPQRLSLPSVYLYVLYRYDFLIHTMYIYGVTTTLFKVTTTVYGSAITKQYGIADTIHHSWDEPLYAIRMATLHSSGYNDDANAADLILESIYYTTVPHHGLCQPPYHSDQPHACIPRDTGYHVKCLLSDCAKLSETTDQSCKSMETQQRPFICKPHPDVLGGILREHKDVLSSDRWCELWHACITILSIVSYMDTPTTSLPYAAILGDVYSWTQWTSLPQCMVTTQCGSSCSPPPTASSHTLFPVDPHHHDLTYKVLQLENGKCTSFLLSRRTTPWYVIGFGLIEWWYYDDEMCTYICMDDGSYCSSTETVFYHTSTCHNEVISSQLHTTRARTATASRFFIRTTAIHVATHLFRLLRTYNPHHPMMDIVQGWCCCTADTMIQWYWYILLTHVEYTATFLRSTTFPHQLIYSEPMINRIKVNPDVQTAASTTTIWSTIMVKTGCSIRHIVDAFPLQNASSSDGDVYPYDITVHYKTAMKNLMCTLMNTMTHGTPVFIPQTNVPVSTDTIFIKRITENYLQQNYTLYALRPFVPPCIAIMIDTMQTHHPKYDQRYIIGIFIMSIIENETNAEHLWDQLQMSQHGKRAEGTKKTDMKLYIKYYKNNIRPGCAFNHGKDLCPWKRWTSLDIEDTLSVIDSHRCQQKEDVHQLTGIKN